MDITAKYIKSTFYSFIIMTAKDILVTGRLVQGHPMKRNAVMDNNNQPKKAIKNVGIG